jgi:hypothetical protein
MSILASRTGARGLNGTAEMGESGSANGEREMPEPVDQTGRNTKKKLRKPCISLYLPIDQSKAEGVIAPDGVIAPRGLFAFFCLKSPVPCVKSTDIE